MDLNMVSRNVKHVQSVVQKVKHKMFMMDQVFDALTVELLSGSAVILQV